MEFKGWVADYKQCMYQGLTDTVVLNLINVLHKMVPDTIKKLNLVGANQERTSNVANQNYGTSVVQHRGQLADNNLATRCHERRTEERTLQTERSSGVIQT